MAARLPRRSFATPFVVTFATAAAACSTGSPPPTAPTGNGPPAEPVATAPNTDPSTGPTTPEPVQPTPPETTGPQAPDPGPPIHRNPPPQTAPEPPAEPMDKPPTDTLRRWTVTKTSDKCHAMAEIHCPTGKPGQPMPTCNPPPASDYACPTSITSYPITIVMRGPNACVIQPSETKCPPKMHCNPPPMRKVPCPE